MEVANVDDFDLDKISRELMTYCNIAVGDATIGFTGSSILVYVFKRDFYGKNIPDKWRGIPVEVKFASKIS